MNACCLPDSGLSATRGSPRHGGIPTLPRGRGGLWVACWLVAAAAGCMVTCMHSIPQQRRGVMLWQRVPMGGVLLGGGGGRGSRGSARWPSL